MKKTFLIALLLIASLPSGARAASPEPPAPATTSTTAAPQAIQSYVQPSYANLARTLWSLNFHSIENDTAIDDFLMISECGLYERFFKNEFEWKKIREATRDYLSKHKSSFPRRYEYVQPLMLDRYDFSLKGFSLMKGSDFKSSDRLEMATNLKNKDQCQGLKYDYIKGYPSNMMVILKQPFKLSFVRVNEDLAKEYLKILADREININQGRPAYMRFRIRFDRYVGTEVVGQREYAILGGALETIEVFADRDLMFKLYEQAFY